MPGSIRKSEREALAAINRDPKAAKSMDETLVSGLKQRGMIAEYSKKIRDAALVVAQREGYTAVLDKGSEGTVKIVLYHHPSVDLTDKVIKELDRQNK